MHLPRYESSWVSFSGIVTGIYTTSSPEACQYIAHDCRANIIVVDTQKQLEKILKVWRKWEVGMGPEVGCSHGQHTKDAPHSHPESPLILNGNFDLPQLHPCMEQGRAIVTYPFDRLVN